MGENLRITILGRKGVGKTSLLNLITKKDLSGASEKTANSISKEVKLFPHGPIVTVYTFSIEDFEKSGGIRNCGTIKTLSKADIAVIVLDSREQLEKSETDLITCLQKIRLPFLIAVNKVEFGINSNLLTELLALDLTHFEISCKENVGIENLKTKLVHLLPHETDISLTDNLIGQGDFILLVRDINSNQTNLGFTKSQVQVMKEALEKETICVVVNNRELRHTLSSLKNPPDLVITDCQSIRRAVAEVPASSMLTTFAILTARQKGNLPEFIRALKRIDELRNGDKILISEACTHHSNVSIGVIQKITNWINKHTGKNLKIHSICDHDFPQNFSEYKLLITCDGCILNRKAMQLIIRQARLMDIPIISYGLIISFMEGVIPRVIIPFKEALSLWDKIDSEVNI